MAANNLTAILKVMLKLAQGERASSIYTDMGTTIVSNHKKNAEDGCADKIPPVTRRHGALLSIFTQANPLRDMERAGFRALMNFWRIPSRRYFGLHTSSTLTLKLWGCPPFCQISRILR